LTRRVVAISPTTSRITDVLSIMSQTKTQRLEKSKCLNRINLIPEEVLVSGIRSLTRNNEATGRGKWMDNQKRHGNGRRVPTDSVVLRVPKAVIEWTGESTRGHVRYGTTFACVSRGTTDTVGRSINIRFRWSQYVPLCTHFRLSRQRGMRLGSHQVPVLLWISSASRVAAFSLIRGRSHFGGTVSVAIRQSSSRRTDWRMAPSDESCAKSSLRVALCQFHVTANKEENHKTAKSFLAQAASKGAQLAVLPEIWNSPYATAAFPEYAESMPGIGDTSADSSPSSQVLMVAAREYGIWIVGGSIPERVWEDGVEKIYNTCLVLNPEGDIVAKHRKVHLFDIDVPGGITFFESATLSAGRTISHFSSPFGEIGVGICYDIRFAEYAMILRQKFNCNILIFPGAFNMTTGPAHWELLQRARAIDNQCYVITTSPARTAAPQNPRASKYPHYTAWGHSTVVSPWGDVVATTDAREDIVIADIDLGKLEEVRKGIPIGNQKRTDLYQLTDSS
jgi:omega-amidase